MMDFSEVQGPSGPIVMEVVGDPESVRLDEGQGHILQSDHEERRMTIL